MSQTPLNGCTRFKEIQRSEAILSAIGCNLEDNAGVGFTSKQATRSGSKMDCGCQVGSSFNEMKRTLRLTVKIARTPTGACSFFSVSSTDWKKISTYFVTYFERELTPLGVDSGEEEYAICKASLSEVLIDFQVGGNCGCIH